MAETKHPYPATEAPWRDGDANPYAGPGTTQGHIVPPTGTEGKQPMEGDRSPGPSASDD
jgi:hypothetical protein